MPSLFEIIKGLWTSDPTILNWYIINGRTILDYFHVIFDNSFYIFLSIAIGLTLVYLIMSLTVTFFNTGKKEKRLDLKKAPFVTIQIPTRNEIIALRCAKKCLNFDYPKNRYEILIGDDSDKPEISQQLVEFARHHKQVKVLKREKNIGFKPGNLNNMLKYSKGDYLVIFDSDFTPEKDFLRRIISPFMHDPEIAAVQARWNFNNFNKNIVTIMASTITYIFHQIVLDFMSLFNMSSLCGSAEAIRKKDLIELGGWTSGSLTEDIEYTLRLYKNDKKIVYLRDLECNNEVPHIALDLYKQQMRWAYGVISSYKKHFSTLITSKISFHKKILSMLHGFGYLMPLFIMFLFVLGVLSFVTNKPGPINLSLFISELARNMFLTSGMLIASLIALKREKKIGYTLKMLVASFSVGLMTTYYVDKGIYKSLMGKPMQWFLLNKKTD